MVFSVFILVFWGYPALLVGYPLSSSWWSFGRLVFSFQGSCRLVGYPALLVGYPSFWSSGLSFWLSEPSFWSFWSSRGILPFRWGIPLSSSWWSFGRLVFSFKGSYRLVGYPALLVGYPSVVVLVVLWTACCLLGGRVVVSAGGILPFWWGILCRRPGGLVESLSFLLGGRVFWWGIPLFWSFILAFLRFSGLVLVFGRLLLVSCASFFFTLQF